MAIPTTTIDTTKLDAGADSLALARPEIKQMADNMNDIVNEFSITGLAKGDILVHDGTDLIDVAVGTNDYVLTADSAEATGVKWAAAGGSSALSEYDTTSDATSSTSEVILSSFLIAADTFTNGDIFDVIAYISATSTGTYTIKFSLNTSSSLTGAAVFVNYSIVNAFDGVITSHNYVRGAGLGIRSTSHLTADPTDSNSVQRNSSATIDWTVDQYLIFSGSVSVGSISLNMVERHINQL